MLEIRTSDKIESHFDSISEWVPTLTIHEDWDSKWHGDYRTVGEAYKASLSCSKYKAEIEKISSKLVAQITASIPDMQPSFDVTGLGFDVGLALSGVPECWITSTPSKDPKVVRILVTVMHSAAITPEQIIKRGIGICTLIQCLEIAGIATEVTVCACNKPEYKAIQCFVQLKSSQDYFDLEKFSFAICDPSFVRMLMFSNAWSRLGHQAGMLGWSVPDTSGYDLFFDRMFSLDKQWANLDSTVDWVVEKCREMGVEISSPLYK